MLSDMDALDEWWAGGRTTSVLGYRLQVRVAGQGPAVLLLHGFPASSYEWAAIEPLLLREHTVVCFDFLGFGASAKPRGHRYSVFEQADLTQALLSELGLTRVAIVAYDYGAIVATELIARQDERIVRCIYLNAGLFAKAYQPRLVQRLALTPFLGAALDRFVSERVFARSWAAVFSPQHPLTHEVAAEHYRALQHGNPGRDLQRRLLRYIPERAVAAARLEDAVVHSTVPIHFLWGLADPVSGPRVAEAIRDHVHEPDLQTYDDAGHCPHIETPQRVATDLLQRLALG